MGSFRLCSFRVLEYNSSWDGYPIDISENKWVGEERNESEGRPALRTLLPLRSVSCPRISLGLLRRGARRRWRVSRGQVTEGARARVFCPGDRAQERLHVVEGGGGGGGQMSYAHLISWVNSIVAVLTLPPGWRRRPHLRANSPSLPLTTAPNETGRREISNSKPVAFFWKF